MSLRRALRRPALLFLCLAVLSCERPAASGEASASQHAVNDTLPSASSPAVNDAISTRPAASSSAVNDTISTRPAASAHLSSNAKSLPAPAQTEHSKAQEGKDAQEPLLDAVQLTVGGQPESRLPWLIALHGLGDTPESFLRLLDGAKLKAHLFALRAPHAYGQGHDWLNARASGNARRLALALEDAAEQIARFIDHHQRNVRTVGKPVVMGFSQGGMLSFAVATRYPEKIALAVPIGGMLPEALWPEPGKAHVSVLPPIVALHGGADTVIPIEPTRGLVARLQQAGFEAQLTEFEDVPHRIPTEMRRRLFDTLESHLSSAKAAELSAVRGEPGGWPSGLGVRDATDGWTSIASPTTFSVKQPHSLR